MSAGNLATSLRRSPRSDTMQAYDALPAEARRWLASAHLPWSARSVARLWALAWRDAGGDLAAVYARMDAAQARKLARDAAQVWGRCYPVAPSAAAPARRRVKPQVPFWQALNRRSRTKGNA
ncbi:hypothetical protein GCM10010873_05840 [Cypionkella aquatica]|uniref:Uncharacterized protein n=1 Tax=Cypionkella aquatica TaxID=1756042 RepID=A0AA37X1X6_9RHOB|nr:DUF6525 family protein [Cypionkella aquatica]GLS85611.1 hypothetical protein GCM10010873_05840 [Cypionkella aquatica]